MDEKDATREKRHNMGKNKSCQEGILIAKETPAAPKAEGISHKSRKNRRVTFVDDLIGPGESVTRNIQNYWQLRRVQSIDAHFRVRFATRNDDREGGIRVDDEEGDRMRADHGSGKLEPAFPTEQLGEKLGEFGEAAAERKVAAFLNQPLAICTCGDAYPRQTPEDTRVVRQITQTLEITTEGLKNELKKVSGTHETSNKRILVELESVQLEVERQSSLILALQKSLSHASEEAQTINQVIAELERELAKSRREAAMYEHKMEMMEAMYSGFDHRAAYDGGVALQNASGVEMLGWEKEELVEKMRELERSHQELYARDAHIWELRQEVNSTIANQAVQQQPVEMTKTEHQTESSGSHTGKFDKPSDFESEKLRIERAQLQKEITALKHDRREVLGQGAMADVSRSEIEQWKRRFEAAQEVLASRERELSELRKETGRATKEVIALRLSLGSAMEDLRTKNRTVDGLRDSIVQLESGVIDLTMACGDLRAERDQLSRRNQERVEEMQDLKNELTEKHAMHANVEVRMENLKKHDDELSGQLSMERDQARMREADLQRALKEMTNRLMEMKAPQEELRKLRASYDGLKGRLEVTTTHLESAQRMLEEKDTEAAELRALLLEHRENGQEDELQRLKKQLAELHVMHEATVSALANDMEAMGSKLKKELEDLTSRNSELDEWLSIQKEQMRIRDEDWSNLQRIHQEEINGLSLENQNMSRKLVDETQGLRNELNEMQESRDRIQEMLELTKARFGDAQRALEQKDEEIASFRTPIVNAQDQLQPDDETIDNQERDEFTKARFGNAQRFSEQKDEEIASLRAPLVSAQDQLQPEDEIIDDQGGDAHSYNDDNVDSLDESVKEGKRPDSGYFSDSGRVKKQGRPLSEVLEDSGLFGKALSLGYGSSLKKKKIPQSAQEAVMKLGNVSRTSSKASMRSV